jgi:hypothetical protein
LLLLLLLGWPAFKKDKKRDKIERQTDSTEQVFSLFIGEKKKKEIPSKLPIAIIMPFSLIEFRLNPRLT